MACDSAGQTAAQKAVRTADLKGAVTVAQWAVSWAFCLAANWAVGKVVQSAALLGAVMAVTKVCVID